MAADARSALQRGVAREAAGDVAVDVAADVAANVFAQLPWIGATPRVRERVVEGAAEGAGKRTIARPLSREASARLARELGLGLGSGHGRGGWNDEDLRRDGNPPLSPGTADGPRRFPRLRGQASARVALAGLTIFASLATSLLHEPAARGSLRASVRSGGARESLQSRGGAPRGAGAMNRKQVLAAVIGVGAVTTGAAAQDAVQWRVEDGGNGHWYRMELSPMGWSVARTAALAKGGDLASFESDAEFSWVRTTISGHPWPSEGCHLGGVQTPSSPSPDAGWSWLTGGQVSLQVNLDFDDNPCGQGCCGENNEQNFLHSYEYWQSLGDSNEVAFAAGCPASFTAYASLIEWSADCNADGIVDYGQILSGELEDTNSNGVPDCCDAGTSCDCPADIDGNGDINGIDLAIILDKWGTNGGKDYPNADIDGDGTIAGADLAEVLGNWGACQ
jgi:hypothetical protein